MAMVPQRGEAASSTATQPLGAVSAPDPVLRASGQGLAGPLTTRCGDRETEARPGQRACQASPRQLALQLDFVLPAPPRGLGVRDMVPAWAVPPRAPWADGSRAFAPSGFLGTECERDPSARVCPAGEVQWAAAPQIPGPSPQVSRNREVTKVGDPRSTLTLIVVLNVTSRFRELGEPPAQHASAAAAPQQTGRTLSVGPFLPGECGPHRPPAMGPTQQGAHPRPPAALSCSAPFLPLCPLGRHALTPSTGGTLGAAQRPLRVHGAGGQGRQPRPRASRSVPWSPSKRRRLRAASAPGGGGPL